MSASSLRLQRQRRQNDEARGHGEDLAGNHMASVFRGVWWKTAGEVSVREISKQLDGLAIGNCVYIDGGSLGRSQKSSLVFLFTVS